jgi:MHS family proline/betaine transporter-like MFS transporter
MAIGTATGGTSSVHPGLRRVIVAATIGNVLEWFDFLVYGFFAVTIAEVFFPASDPTVSLLITFGTFGLAYVVRPLGAIFIGTYSDRAGRKAGLTLSIGLMLIGTTLMVITPGYATIGIAAPIIITVARVLQGFSVGGEFGSAVAFLVEHGGERRGFSASWQWATTGIVSVIVSLFGLALTTLLSHEQLIDWGWRVPYVFGLLVGPAGLYIRSRIAETADFLAVEKPTTMPIGELLRRYPVALLLALGASIVSNSSYYLLLYVPTYGVKTLHLPAYTGFAATLLGGIILAVFSVVAGYWSDKIVPRSRIMLIAAWLFLLAAYPCFWLMDAYPSLATAAFAVGFLNLIKAGYSGVLPSVLSEQFPVETRAVGVSLSFSISVTIFGGFAPFVATWLIAQTGDPLSPSYYLMATALLSIIALMAIQRRAPVPTR